MRNNNKHCDQDKIKKLTDLNSTIDKLSFQIKSKLNACSTVLNSNRESVKEKNHLYKGTKKPVVIVISVFVLIAGLMLLMFFQGGTFAGKAVADGGGSDGLILHYSFDDSVTTDESSSGLNGILSRPGIFAANEGLDDSGAMDFSESRDHVNAGQNVVLNLRRDFTFSALINPVGFGPNQNSGFGRIFSKDRRIELYLEKFSVDTAKVSYKFRYGGKYIVFRTVNAVVSLNEWQKVTLTFDGLHPKLYVDGEEKDFIQVKGKTIPNKLFNIQGGWNRDLTVGNRKKLDRAFQGKIDEFKVFNRVLTDDEIVSESQDLLGLVEVDEQNYRVWVSGDRGEFIHSRDSGETWFVQGAENRGEDFRLVYFLTSDVGWAVSDRAIYNTINGGEDWIEFGVGIHGSRVWDIVFVNSQVGFITGSGGTLLKTEDGGNNWEDKSDGIVWANNRYRLDQSTIYSSYFLNENVGWISVGPYSMNGEGQIYKTINGGNDWNSIATIRNDQQDWSSFRTNPLILHFNNQDEGLVVGSRSARSYTVRKYLYQIREGNSNFLFDNLEENGINYDLRSSYFLNQNEGFAVGYSEFRKMGLHKTNDRGNNWVSSNLNIGEDSIPTKVLFYNRNDGWIITAKDPSIPRAVARAYVYRTNDGGQTWRIIYSGVKDLNDIVVIPTVISAEDDCIVDADGNCIAGFPGVEVCTDDDEDGYCSQEDGDLPEGKLGWGDCDDSGGYSDRGKYFWQYLDGYVDSDNDGFGSGELQQVCSGEDISGRYALQSGDCNDDDYFINPDSTEICGNDVDDDCNPQTADDDDVDIDTVCDSVDNCPNDVNNDQLDTDEDGLGDVCDLDDDNDGLTDVQELELGLDPLDDDTDGDRVLDNVDNCPLDPESYQGDADNDGLGNVCDDDDDNDGVLDCGADGICAEGVITGLADDDNCPLIKNGNCDADENNCDANLDGEVTEEEIAVGNQLDSDEDTLYGIMPRGVQQHNVGDICLGLNDGSGEIRYKKAGQLGPKKRCGGDACDPVEMDDNDNDLIINMIDNCPSHYNPDQLDVGDQDGIGDVCDECPGDADNDIDGDGLCGDIDNCPDVASDNLDSDGDGAGDQCDLCANEADNDVDGDGICAGVGFNAPKTADNDNCPEESNPDQLDEDGDGIGDVCDQFNALDEDGDGVDNGQDQCENTLPEGVVYLDGDKRGCLVGDQNLDGCVRNEDNIVAQAQALASLQELNEFIRSVITNYGLCG